MDNSTTQQSGQSPQIPGEIRNFLETLLQDAGMTSLDDQMHEEMIKELYIRLDNFITSTIINNLPPEHLEEFIKANQEKKPLAEIEQFLKDKMPNVHEVFAQAFTEFRDMYLGNVTAARNAPKSTASN